MLPWIIALVGIGLFVLIIWLCWDELFGDNDSRGGMP